MLLSLLLGCAGLSVSSDEMTQEDWAVRYAESSCAWNERCAGADYSEPAAFSACADSRAKSVSDAACTVDLDLVEACVAELDKARCDVPTFVQGDPCAGFCQDTSE